MITKMILNIDYVAYIPYVFLFIVLIIAIIYTTIRLQYGFWFYQPVFHAYDFHYYLFYNGIIRKELPQENKFVNEREIQVLDFTAVEDHQIQQFVHFINTHFHKRGKNQYIPKKENIVPYFKEHSHPCFFSFYKEDAVLQDGNTSDVISDKKCIGVMTTRPLHVRLFTEKTRDEFDVYYADYLCVHMDYRKKGTAPQIIQTHEYVQRRRNKSILVSLFKREGELTGIVPLCVYKIYCFSIGNWRKPTVLPVDVELIEATPQNYSYLHDFMKTVTVEKFQAIITPTLANVFELMKSGNLFVFYLLDKTTQEILGAYFFKDSCMMIDEGGKALTCIASVQSKSCSKEVFINGFKNAFWRIVKSNPAARFGYCVVEDVSDNGVLVLNVLEKTTPLIVSPAAYFFYNFAFPTLPSSKTFVLS
jgi:hypothetical protein